MNDDQLDDLLRDAAHSYNLPPMPPREEIWARIESARRANASPLLLHRGRTRWLTSAAGIAAVLVLGIAIGRTTRGAGDAPATRTVAAVDVGQPAVPVPVQRIPAGEGSTDADTRGDLVEPEPAHRSHAAPDAAPSIATNAAAGDRSTVRAARPARTEARMVAAAGSTSTAGTPGAAGGEGTEMNAYRFAVVEHLARTEVLLTGFRATAGGMRATPADAAQFGTLSRELLQNTRLLLATHASEDPVLTRLLQDLELVLMQISQYAAEGGARRGDLDAINQSLDRRNVLPKLRSTIPAGAPAPSGT